MIHPYLVKRNQQTTTAGGGKGHSGAFSGAGFFELQQQHETSCWNDIITRMKVSSYEFGLPTQAGKWISHNSSYFLPWLGPFLSDQVSLPVSACLFCGSWFDPPLLALFLTTRLLLTLTPGFIPWIVYWPLLLSFMPSPSLLISPES